MPVATRSTRRKSLQEQLDSQRRLVDVDHYDITVRELMRMTVDGELERAPVYQRKFRWDLRDESRLIESLFLGLPVPSLFVATNKDGTWELIDGLQRISTLLHFTAENDEELQKIDKSAPLKLTDLDKLSEFNGLEFSDLPTPVQLSFWKKPLRVTALSDKSEPNVRFDMFERLNTGGVTLTPQEVRACIFRGPFNDFLREAAELEAFRSLVKLQKTRQDDGTREELVLKFFAYLENRESFDGAVTRFLNEFMNRHRDRRSGRDRQLFERIVGFLVDACQGGPFLRQGYPNTPQNQLEAAMVAAGELIREGEELKQPATGWREDRRLVEASTKGTNTPSALRRRIERARELLTGAEPEPR